MAVTYGFYNSLNKDRMYNAEQMSSIFNGIITDGVFSTIGDALMTVAGTGMQVIVKPGRAWFNSTWTLNDAQLPLDVPAADVSLARIDAVILEVNSAVATRANSIKVLKGTPSANPTKPTLSATETLHQYALAYITVGAGITSITAANIEINVGKTSCPFITSVLQQTDITDLFNQWNAEFTTWFENVQAQLSGDVAANLQRQIDALKNADNILITDTSAGILSLPADSSVDKGLQELGLKVNMILAGTATLNLTVQDASGSPVPGIKITGMTSISGSDEMITNSDGKLSGYIPGGTSTVGISGYGDIEDASISVTADKGSTVSKTITIARRNFLKVTKSQNIKFSSNVQSIDFTIGGGGGSGSTDAYFAHGGAGGGGGYSVEQTNVEVTPNLEYPAIIGAGGAETEQGGSGSQGPMGNDGGATSFMGATAAGGKHPTFNSDHSQHIGGAGNGTGADNVSTNTAGTVMNNGTNGSGKMYTSYTEATNAYGGGGGCGAPAGRYAGRYEGPGGNGGAPGGGNGGYNENQYTSNDYGAPGNAGTDGLGGGGGGGAASISNDKSYYSGKGGKGGNGALAIRMRLTIGV